MRRVAKAENPVAVAAEPVAVVALEPPREVRVMRERRSAPADPFFDKPYEAPENAEAPAWEAAAKPATSRVSTNIKTRRKGAALFKSE